jgi:nucleolar protein 56
MGLFWSMRPVDAAPDEPLPPDERVVPDASGYDVTLRVEVDGEPVAETTLALQYLGDPDPIPDALVEVPVEGVERAIAWLRDRERVAGPEVGLFGFSRGGELALLLGSRTDDVGAIVGWVPSGLVWQGLGDGRAPADTSAWSVDGEPVPYLASATDDRRWPSTALSARVVDRLAEHEYPHGYRHDSFEGAGHFLGLPHLPTAGTSRDRWNVYGGSPAANARARSRAWTETLSLLESTRRE